MPGKESPMQSEMLQGTLDMLILQTLAGQTRVQQACAELGVGETRFHQLRLDALQAAVDQLELRPAGRPALPPIDPHIAERRPGAPQDA